MRSRSPRRARTGHPQPILDAGRFSHEAVAWLDGALRDRGPRRRRVLPLRPRAPAERRRRSGDVRRHAPGAGVRGRNRATSTRTRRNPGETYAVEWVTIDEPNPLTEHRPRAGAGQGRRHLQPHRGDLGHRRGLYFDCTTGGEAGWGSCGSTPLAGRRRAKADLRVRALPRFDAPDNLVVVPHRRRLPAGGRRQRAFVHGVRGRDLRLRQDRHQRHQFCGGCFCARRPSTFSVPAGRAHRGDPDGGLAQPCTLRLEAVWKPLNQSVNRLSWAA